MSTFYSEDDAWVRIDGEAATVGITRYAAKELCDLHGDIYEVKVPPIGRLINRGDRVAEVNEIGVYAPIGGYICDAHGELVDDPTQLGVDPEGVGWLFKLEPCEAYQTEQLMTAERYEAFCGSRDASA